ncbi:MAG: hypothetical protein WAU56_07475 [Steroidobacteraceae bacterium]
MNIVAQPQRQQQPCPDLAQLPPAIADRLAAEGVYTLADWRALGRKRLQLFGITRAMAAQLDELARHPGDEP